VARSCQLKSLSILTGDSKVNFLRCGCCVRCNSSRGCVVGEYPPMRVYARAALLGGTIERCVCFPGRISEKRSALLYRSVDVTHGRPLAAGERALPRLLSLGPRPQPAAGHKPRFLQAVASNVMLLQADLLPTA